MGEGAWGLCQALARGGLECWWSEKKAWIT